MRERLVLALLALAPVIALSPALLEDRIVSPGDGAFLHFPLRAAVWQAVRHGELPSWNGAIFSGTPLLAAYRPGALYPPMLALSWLPPFEAFQLLVTASLCAATVLTFLYLRRLGANRIGAYVAGVCFGLGPYLVGHLDDAATIIAAPLLPLVLLAAEGHMRASSPRRSVGLALALALLLVAGSPEAARAGLALVVGRLAVGHLFRGSGERPPVLASLLVIGAACLLAAPQLLPSLLAAREAGRALTGLATESAAVPGVTGLVLRYVSHSPAPAFALAALPLLVTQTPVRVFGVALGLCYLAIQPRPALRARSARARLRLVPGRARRFVAFRPVVKAPRGARSSPARVYAVRLARLVRGSRDFGSHAGTAPRHARGCGWRSGAGDDPVLCTRGLAPARRRRRVAAAIQRRFPAAAPRPRAVEQRADAQRSRGRHLDERLARARDGRPRG